LMKFKSSQGYDAMSTGEFLPTF